MREQRLLMQVHDWLHMPYTSVDVLNRSIDRVFRLKGCCFDCLDIVSQVLKLKLLPFNKVLS